MSSSNTCLDYIYANVIYASFDLFLHKVRWRLVDTVDTLSVLGSQGRSGRHRIAAMSGDHLLVGFEPSDRYGVSFIASSQLNQGTLTLLLSCPSPLSPVFASL